MTQVVGIIEKSEDGGFSIYAEALNGVFGYGLTEEEAREDFVSVIHEQAEYYKEKKGLYPEWYSDNIEVTYLYDISGFFEAFPFINASAFAKEIGINESLMRRYKNRTSFAGRKQKNIIQSGYERILRRMQSVKF